MPSDHLWQQLFLQIVLILINAFFAATEIAIISLNENILRYQADDGDVKAARLLKIVQAPNTFLSTIQIGITLAGFLASAFAASSFATRLVAFLTQDLNITTISPDALYTISVIIVTFILSFFTLIFGELVPKRIAMQKADQLARRASGVISVFSVFFRPIIWLLSVTTNGVLRLLHIDPHPAGEDVSEEEIRMLMDIGEEKGTIEASEKVMIENIFEFNNMSAEDVMTHRTDMALISLEDTDEEIVQMIEETGLSRFPVYDEDTDDIIGILSTREYLLNARRPEPKSLLEILRPAYFVPESVRTDILFQDMQNKKVHMAIVVDEYGGTSGLVTMEDLLEEIVGNIYDEFDPQVEQDIIQLEENLWRITGQAELEQIAEVFHITFPEDEESDTLSGLVFSQLSVIPEDGSRLSVDVNGLHIQVEEISDRRIEWALVSKLPKQDQ